ncbi:hypothetical protein PIB30_056866 [Stylosanthes scabra]|uniref:Uncharacterized protein n=1 Tax=Stylosanthes scabra TaxID=79078 RepID=A0ABU6TLN8_9FABA|nr:hypothetical protein [Stylosanthes scabra]
MGSGVIYYKYEAHKGYNDVDIEATADLGTIKIHRYHFKDKKFTRSVHSGRIDPIVLTSSPSLCSAKEVLSESLGLHLRCYCPSLNASHGTYVVVGAISSDLPSMPTLYPSSAKEIFSHVYFIPPSEGWMCDDDEEMKKSEKEGRSETGERQEKSKTTMDSQPMDASSESGFPGFLMNDTRPVYSSFGSCLTIDSRDYDLVSGYTSGSHSFGSGNLSGVWPTSSASSE